MRRNIQRCGALLSMLLVTGAAAAQDIDAAAFLRDGANRANSVRLTGVKAGSTTVTLDLQRFEVFARNAQLRADDGQGKVQTLPRPTTRYYRGEVVQTGAAAFLAVEDD
ncbi:MAG TPA: hypothetical protein VN153_03585, partial [Tahibacter sp.]|nr:hypothetical protein [Tahibacter sp.]